MVGLAAREQQVSLLSNGEGRENSWDSTEVQRLSTGLASLSELSSILQICFAESSQLKGPLCTEIQV